VGARRRGYTPEGMQLFCERIGVSSRFVIDYSLLEDCMREDFERARRAPLAVLDPLN